MTVDTPWGYFRHHCYTDDGNDAQDGKRMALMAPKQVAMPKMVIQTPNGTIVQNLAPEGQSLIKASEEEGDTVPPPQASRNAPNDVERAAANGGETSSREALTNEIEHNASAFSRWNGAAAGEGLTAGLKRSRPQQAHFNDDLAAKALMALAEAKRSKT